MSPAQRRAPVAAALVLTGFLATACTAPPSQPLTPDEVLAAQWLMPPPGHLLAQAAGTTEVRIDLDPVTLDLRNVPALERPQLVVAVTCTGSAEAQLAVDGAATGTASCGHVDGDMGYIGFHLTGETDAESPHTFVVEVGADEVVAVSVLVVERPAETTD